MVSFQYIVIFSASVWSKLFIEIVGALLLVKILFFSLSTLGADK